MVELIVLPQENLPRELRGLGLLRVDRADQVVEELAETAGLNNIRAGGGRGLGRNRCRDGAEAEIDSLPAWKIAGAAVVLAGISAAALAGRRKCPWLLVGWLWYLGMLVPVIGVVQVGAHAMADRYTYLPQIGLCIALAWGILYLTASWPNRRWALGIASALIVAALMGCAWHQTTFWRNSETLWTHALACNSENDTAHTDLGCYLKEEGRTGEAIDHFKAALEVAPNNADAHLNLGEALASLNCLDEAEKQYREVLRINDKDVEAHYNLGVAWAKQGRLDDAIQQYEEALKIKPDLADAHANLGVALELRGQIDEALMHYRTALVLATRQGKGPLAENLKARLRQLSDGDLGPQQR